MSTLYSPKIVTDGLVLMLDAANPKSCLGGNIIKGTGAPYLSITGWSEYGWGGSIAIDSTENALKLTSINGWHNMTYNPGVTGQTMTITFDAKWSQLQSASNYLFILNGQDLGTYTQSIGTTSSFTTTSYTRFTFTFTSTTDPKIAIGSRNTDSGGLTDIVFIRNLKVEVGSSSTTWTPSMFDNGGWIDLSGNKSIYGSTYYTYPPYIFGSFKFVNDGTIVNQIVVTTQNLSTYNHTTYTRSAWFYQTDSSSAWSPIIQNQIGNNSDLGLTIASSKLHFRQYSNTYTSGTTSGDYGVSGDLTVNTGQWYMATMCVNLPANQVTFYLNDQLDSTKTINKIGNAASDIIIIGGSSADSYSGGRMFKGYIAIVSHYNKLLSASEVTQNYNTTKKRFGL